MLKAAQLSDPCLKTFLVPPPFVCFNYPVWAISDAPTYFPCIAGVVEAVGILLVEQTIATSSRILPELLAALSSHKKALAEYRHPRHGMSLVHLCCRLPETINMIEVLRSHLGEFLDVNAGSLFGTPLFYARLFVQSELRFFCLWSSWKMWVCRSI